MITTNIKKQLYIGLASALAAAAAYGATQTIARFVVTSTAPASVSATWTIFFGMIFLLFMSLNNIKMLSMHTVRQLNLRQKILTYFMITRGQLLMQQETLRSSQKRHSLYTNVLLS